MSNKDLIDFLMQPQVIRGLGEYHSEVMSCVKENQRLREVLEHIVECDRKPDSDKVRHYKAIAKQALGEIDE